MCRRGWLPSKRQQSAALPPKEQCTLDILDVPDDERHESLAERRKVRLESMKAELAKHNADFAAAVNVKSIATRALDAHVRRYTPEALGVVNAAKLFESYKVPNIADMLPKIVDPTARLKAMLDTNTLFKSAGRAPSVVDNLQASVAGLARPVAFDALQASVGADVYKSLAGRLTLDSGLMKSIEAAQAAAVFSLPKAPKFDFGVGALNKSVDATFRKQFLDPDLFKRFYERFKPRNLRGADVGVDEVEAIMRDEGIPFCLVPDLGTVELLVAAGSRSVRRAVLVERVEHIFDSCDNIIDLCVGPGLPEQGVLIRMAISAHRDGHVEAAQALATGVLDKLIAQHPHGSNIKSAAKGHAHIDEHFGTRDTFFMYPIPVSHTGTAFLADKSNYSRHATVHDTNLKQLNASNSVQAIMLATSILGYHQDLW